MTLDPSSGFDAVGSYPGRSATRSTTVIGDLRNDFNAPGSVFLAITSSSRILVTSTNGASFTAARVITPAGSATNAAATGHLIALGRVNPDDAWRVTVTPDDTPAFTESASRSTFADDPTTIASSLTQSLNGKTGFTAFRVDTIYVTRLAGDFGAAATIVRNPNAGNAQLDGELEPKWTQTVALQPAGPATSETNIDGR